MFRFKLRLTNNLIDTLTGSNFFGIEYLQIHLLTIVDQVVFVVSLNLNHPTINQFVGFVWILTPIYLVDDLLHFRVCQRKVTKAILVTVIIIQNGSPILYELLFCWIEYHCGFPTMLC